jgi:hypothetical protein
VNPQPSSPHRSTTLTLTVSLVLVGLMTPIFIYLALADRAANHAVDDPAKLMAFTVWSACVAVFLIIGLILLLRPLFMKGMRPRVCAEKKTNKREALWQQLTSAPPAFSLDQARTWLGEMRPLVEALTGRKFRRDPQLELVEWQQLGKVLANEKMLPLQTGGGSGGLAGRLLELAALPSTLPLTPFIIGKYGTASRTVYLLPRNTAAVMKLAKLGPEDVEAIVKLTICHELVHALQDDHLDLSECLRDAQTSGDPMAPFNVVMEGHAMLIQAQVAEHLGLRTPQAALEGLLLGKEEEAVEGTRMSQVYRLGLDYMGREFVEGGCDRLWERLHEPPNIIEEVA